MERFSFVFVMLLEIGTMAGGMESEKWDFSPANPMMNILPGLMGSRKFFLHFMNWLPVVYKFYEYFVSMCFLGRVMMGSIQRVHFV